MTKVYIVGGDFSVVKMFINAGFLTITHLDTARKEDFDLLCFTGGEDVSPYLYNEENIASYCNEARDDLEVAIYDEFIDKKKVGICRGGQLLNVLNGGKIIQHLGKTVSGKAECKILWGAEDDCEDIILHVDHHQGIVRNRDVPTNGATFNKELGLDIDYSVFYPDTKSWCFQPHPEWGHEGTKNFFFEMIAEYHNLRGD